MAENGGNPPDWGRQWSDFWRVAGVSFTVALLAGAGAVGGVALDRRLGTKPAFSLILLFLGLAAGAWYAYKALTEMLK
ncbi:MAG: AtpZ/AtpI family protein [Planctomycetota bacterium]|jgi:F0F1-type ATP synthase assembly protein I